MARVSEFVYDSEAGVYPLRSVIGQLARFRVRRVEVPLTYYSFLGGEFTFRESSFGPIYSFTLPAGNYDVTTLAAALKAGMESETPSYTTYTWTYDQATGKYSVLSSGPDLVWILPTAASALAGFTGAGALASLVAGDIPAAPAGPLRHLTLVSPELGPRLLSPPEHTTAIQNAIVSIPLTVSPMSVLVWEPALSRWMECSAGVGPLQRLSFQLVRDDTGGNVDLNGPTFTVVLELAYD